MRLSLLDRSRTRAGRPEAEGLTGSVHRAVHAEQVGYERFWVAEHHAVPGIASGAPAVLLAAIGAATGDDRVVIASLDNCSVTVIDVSEDGTLTLVETGGEADTLIR